MMGDAMPAEVAARYAQVQSYLDEGHLVIGQDLGEDAGERRYHGVCSCGAASSEAPVGYIDGEDLSWWQRGHRMMHGLVWQAFTPRRPLSRRDVSRLAGEHLVELTHDETSWSVLCTCEEYEALDTFHREEDARRAAETHLHARAGRWAM